MATEDPPGRPRRDRPLVAAGREQPPDAEATAPPPPPPPTSAPPPPPPTGPPLVEFAASDEPAERDDHVEVSFAGPTLQRRWTVALRFILIVPHLFWAAVLGSVANVVVFIAWFAALFTARVPEGMASFLTRVLQYQTRLYGYGYLLLTDEYPSFALDADDYAINVTTAPGELNRAAVFFRTILIVPSAIVSWLLLFGAAMVGVVAWLLTLIMGRLPTSLWEANAAVLRYYTRTYAFASLLTAEQPNRAFGDRPGGGFAPTFDGDVPDLPERPRIVRLVLSKAAKRIMVLFIVAAVVGSVGFFAVFSVNVTKFGEANRDLTAAYLRLENAYTARVSDIERCSFNGGAACQQSANAEFAGAFERFAADVRAIDFPASIDASVLVEDAETCAEALHGMADATSPSEFEAAQSDYHEAEQTFNQDYNDVAYQTRFD